MNINDILYEELHDNKNCNVNSKGKHAFSKQSSPNKLPSTASSNLVLIYSIDCISKI